MALAGVGPLSTPQPHLSLSHAENTWRASCEDQAPFLPQVRTESQSPPIQAIDPECVEFLGPALHLPLPLGLLISAEV